MSLWVIKYKWSKYEKGKFEKSAKHISQGVIPVENKRTGRDDQVASAANKSVFGIEVGDIQRHVELKI